MSEQTWTKEEIEAAMGDDDKLVKVRVPGESFWAYKFGEYVILANEPLEDAYNYMDVCEVNSGGSLGKVIFKMYPKRLGILYYFEEEEAGKKRWETLGKAFVSLGLNHPEGYMPGRSAVSVPADTKIEDIEAKLIELDDTKVLWEGEDGETDEDYWFFIQDLGTWGEEGGEA